MNVICHRNDLRIRDNKAVEAAGERSFPVYIFDPEWWENELVSDARREFVLESLSDLNRQYRQHGTELIFLEGKPLEKLEELKYEVYFNRDSNHFNQEEEAKLRNYFKSFSATPATDPDVDRNNWDQAILDWLESKPFRPPERLSEPRIESETSIEDAERKYSVNRDKEKFGLGGSSKARERLAKFKKKIDEYSGSISSPAKAESSTSHLSPYIRYGCISPREVYRSIDGLRNKKNTVSVEMFLDRIVWQQHFNKKLEDNPDLFREAINPVYRDLHRENYDEDRVKAWKEGKTGYPLVDASMRALVEKGWLNFRMRAICASFFSYILQQWWKIGADFYFKHLIDSDVAINYYQWQMQSGLVGVHANRIYNPVKQAEENDPDGVFVRKYVPELEDVPDSYIKEPWKMPDGLQEDISTLIGKDYPRPVVEYDRKANEARSYFQKKAPEAYAAFKDDKVWKKASLSSKHSRKKIVEKAGSKQTDLENFD